LDSGWNRFWCFFYEKYNNENCILRFVAAKCLLECWNKGLIEQFEDEKKEENHVQTQNPIKYRAIRAGSAVPCKI
jgi:hypothetical protein